MSSRGGDKVQECVRAILNMLIRPYCLQKMSTRGQLAYTCSPTWKPASCRACIQWCSLCSHYAPFLRLSALCQISAILDTRLRQSTLGGISAFLLAGSTACKTNITSVVDVKALGSVWSFQLCRAPGNCRGMLVTVQKSPNRVGVRPYNYKNLWW